MPARQRRNYGKIRATVGAIAQERIEILLSESRKNLDHNPTLSKRYTQLAKKISMRTKVRIPAAEKRYICKHCGLPLIPGKNARIRVLPGNPRIVITCLECGALKRYPYTKNRA
jgi:ribonuclease P protein subunit RPR2